MNNYNFQIIPPHSGKVRQIRIEGSKLKRLLIWLSIIVVLNLLVFGINIYFVLNTTSQTKLATINKELLNKLEQTSRRSDSLGLALSDIAKFTEQVRSLADLPPTDPGMFSYGIGGPELGYHDPNRPFVLAKAREVDRKLDSLIIAARLENEALTEAKTVFEKKQKVFAHTPSIWPMRGFVSSGFGKRLDPFTGIWKMHEGIDICARKGTPVLTVEWSPIRSSATSIISKD